MRIFCFYTLNSVTKTKKSNYLPEETEKVKEFELDYQDQVLVLTLIDRVPRSQSMLFPVREWEWYNNRDSSF